MFTNKHLPRFNKVCFCCPLRIGNIILVYVNLMLSLGVNTGYIVTGFVKLILRAPGPNEFDWMHRMIRFKSISMAATIMVFLYILAEICMAVVILIGLHKNIYKYILVYMYYTIFSSIWMALSRILDVENQIWYIELGVDVVFYVFKAYYVLSIRSQIKTMNHPDKGDDEHSSGDMEMKVTSSEMNEVDLNAQSVNNIEKILNDETLDSESDSSEFGSTEPLIH